MKVIILISAMLLVGCSGGVPEDQAVQNIRDDAGIDQSKADSEIKEAMQNACDLIDSLGLPLVAVTMSQQGYSNREAEAFLSNASAVYCPEHLEKVQEIGG